MTDNIELVEWYEAEASRTRSGASVDPMIHAALGLCSESGEFASAVKAHLMYERTIDKTNCLEELGDILWFMSLAADSLGFSLRNVMLANIAKLRKRYPEGSFSQERANNRDTQMEIEEINYASVGKDSEEYSSYGSGDSRTVVTESLGNTLGKFPAGTEVRIEFTHGFSAVGDYAVTLVSNPEYWIDAFKTHELAMQFCRDMKFVVHFD